MSCDCCTCAHCSVDAGLIYCAILVPRYFPHSVPVLLYTEFVGIVRGDSSYQAWKHTQKTLLGGWGGGENIFILKKRLVLQHLKGCTLFWAFQYFFFHCLRCRLIHFRSSIPFWFNIREFYVLLSLFLNKPTNLCWKMVEMVVHCSHFPALRVLLVFDDLCFMFTFIWFSLSNSSFMCGTYKVFNAWTSASSLGF